MAKKKRSRKQKIASKLINAGGLAIGLSRFIEIFLQDGFSTRALQRIRKGLTFGLAEGGFNLEAGLRMYGPVGASVGYREFTKYLMKRFPIR